MEKCKLAIINCNNYHIYIKINIINTINYKNRKYITAPPVVLITLNPRNFHNMRERKILRTFSTYTRVII